MYRDEWEKRIKKWWNENKEMIREDDMMEYMRIEKDIEMYGVN